MLAETTECNKLAVLCEVFLFTEMIVRPTKHQTSNTKRLVLTVVILLEIKWEDVESLNLRSGPTLYTVLVILHTLISYFTVKITHE